MRSLYVDPSQLSGTIAIPPSKSHTLRALLFAMMAKEGRSILYNPLPSPDSEAMVQALRLFGAQVDTYPDRIEVTPCFRGAEDVINTGNSGQVLRFIGALAGLLPSYTVLTGDASIRSNRPVTPLLEGLSGLGGVAVSSRLDGRAPIIIRGPIAPGSTRLHGADSQPVSGLLIAASFLDGETHIQVDEPGERPWIDLTLSWLGRLGIACEQQDYTAYHVKGRAAYPGFTVRIPGDFSSSAYPLTAALVTNSALTLQGIDMTDTQGDKELITQLIQMGAQIEIASNSLTVRRGSSLKGMRIDANRFIDALPLLAVVGCYAEGETEVYNGAIARRKESDRIRAIVTELRKMGAAIEERPDGFVVHHSPLQGAELSSHADHRIALSLTVAALGAKGRSAIRNSCCIAKSYPSFVEAFSRIGAKIREKP